jgi:hypothetical protein
MKIDRKPDGSLQFTTVADSMSIINPSPGLLRPPSAHLLSETAIVGRLAMAISRFFLVTPYSSRCLAAYFPEGNVLVQISSVADESNQPTSKSVRVRLRGSVNADKVGQQLKAET